MEKTAWIAFISFFYVIASFAWGYKIECNPLRLSRASTERPVALSPHSCIIVDKTKPHTENIIPQASVTELPSDSTYKHIRIVHSDEFSTSSQCFDPNETYARENQEKYKLIEKCFSERLSVTFCSHFNCVTLQRQPFYSIIFIKHIESSSSTCPSSNTLTVVSKSCLAHRSDLCITLTPPTDGVNNILRMGLPAMGDQKQNALFFLSRNDYLKSVSYTERIEDSNSEPDIVMTHVTDEKNFLPPQKVGSTTIFITNLSKIIERKEIRSFAAVSFFKESTKTLNTSPLFPLAPTSVLSNPISSSSIINEIIRHSKSKSRVPVIQNNTPTSTSDESRPSSSTNNLLPSPSNNLNLSPAENLDDSVEDLDSSPINSPKISPTDNPNPSLVEKPSVISVKNPDASSPVEDVISSLKKEDHANSTPNTGSTNAPLKSDVSSPVTAKEQTPIMIIETWRDYYEVYLTPSGRSIQMFSRASHDVPRWTLELILNSSAEQAASVHPTSLAGQTTVHSESPVQNEQQQNPLQDLSRSTTSSIKGEILFSNFPPVKPSLKVPNKIETQGASPQTVQGKDNQSKGGSEPLNASSSLTQEKVEKNEQPAQQVNANTSIPSNTELSKFSVVSKQEAATPASTQGNVIRTAPSHVTILPGGKGPNKDSPVLHPQTQPSGPLQVDNSHHSRPVNDAKAEVATAVGNEGQDKGTTIKQVAAKASASPEIVSSTSESAVKKLEKEPQKATDASTHTNVIKRMSSILSNVLNINVKQESSASDSEDEKQGTPATTVVNSQKSKQGTNGSANTSQNVVDAIEKNKQIPVTKNATAVVLPSKGKSQKSPSGPHLTKPLNAINEDPSEESDTTEKPIYPATQNEDDKTSDQDGSEKSMTGTQDKGADGAQKSVDDVSKKDKKKKGVNAMNVIIFVALIGCAVLTFVFFYVNQDKVFAMNPQDFLAAEEEEQL